MVDSAHPENGAELGLHSAVGKLLLLVEGDTAVFEAAAIIEYIAAFHPGQVTFCGYHLQGSSNAVATSPYPDLDLQRSIVKLNPIDQ